MSVQTALEERRTLGSLDGEPAVITMRQVVSVPEIPDAATGPTGPDIIVLPPGSSGTSSPEDPDDGRLITPPYNNTPIGYRVYQGPPPQFPEEINPPNLNEYNQPPVGVRGYTW